MGAGQTPSAIGRGLTLRRFALAILVLGVAVRATAFMEHTVPADAATYAVMADSFLHNGEFILPYGEWFDPNWDTAYSHHFGPAYPLFLSPFIAVGGLHPETIIAAAFVSGMLFIAAAYLATRHLYGPQKALLVAAIAAIDPILVESARAGYSENFLATLFVLTIWAIIASLRDGPLIVFAGLFAGLSYMTKGVMGWFFLLAGFAGLAWRLHFMGWRVFRDRYYLAAIAIFATFVAVWSSRNIAHFWDGNPAGLVSAWQSSAYLQTAEIAAASHPVDLTLAMAARVPFFGGLFLLAGGAWLGRLRALPKISDEHYSGLWLAVGLTYVLAWIITGIFWTLERSDLFWVDPARYVAIANVVIFWLVLREADLDAREFSKRFVATVVMLLIVAAVVLSAPKPYAFEAYDALEAASASGDLIAVDALNRYEVVVNVGADRFYERFEANSTADFVVTSDLGLQPPGYTLLYAPHDGRVTPGPTFGVAVWARA